MLAPGQYSQGQLKERHCKWQPHLHLPDGRWGSTTSPVGQALKLNWRHVPALLRSKFREFVAGWEAAGTHGTVGERCVMPGCPIVTGAINHLEADEWASPTSRAASTGIHGMQSGKGAELHGLCGGAGLVTHRNGKALSPSPEVLFTSTTSWPLSQSGKLWGDTPTLQGMRPAAATDRTAKSHLGFPKSPRRSLRGNNSFQSLEEWAPQKNQIFLWSWQQESDLYSRAKKNSFVKNYPLCSGVNFYFSILIYYSFAMPNVYFICRTALVSITLTDCCLNFFLSFLIKVCELQKCKNALNLLICFVYFCSLKNSQLFLIG